MDQLTVKQLASMIDHTNLRAHADEAAMRLLCNEAKTYGFAMVAVNSAQTERCKRFLEGSGVHVGAAIGFPLGQTTIAAKVFETRDALDNGADEIDYVVNLSELKSGNWDFVRTEMESIVAVCREAGAISKVIFENCYLEEDEIRKLAELAVRIRPDFIKTSTGFGTGGALAQDVRLMKEIVRQDVQVKAAGGIRDWKTCRNMIEAGATRIGTSSGVSILEEFRKSLPATLRRTE